MKRVVPALPIFSLLAVSFGWGRCLWKSHRSQSEAFQAVGIAFMLTEETLDFQYAYDLGIPRALSDRESAVIHYFLLAEALDGGESSQALYWLGRYLADRDCDLAVYYLERHLEEWGSRPQDTRDRIEKLRSKGCEGGMEGHE